MATMQISVPDNMKTLVESHVRDGLYADVSDYIRNLIRADLGAEGDWEVTPELEAAIEEGEASGYVPFDPVKLLNEARSKYRSD
ncbi:ribbon-helix-helix domain-containing protein [Sphingomonas sp. LT1P40]|uniref:ribbon-helix-helix domain-containing protein n=1 Tax=Alteristakelama amylovorans TaxID=3096166 RepID=UPI002FCC7910